VQQCTADGMPGQHLADDDPAVSDRPLESATWPFWLRIIRTPGPVMPARGRVPRDWRRLDIADPARIVFGLSIRIGA